GDRARPATLRHEGRRPRRDRDPGPTRRRALVGANLPQPRADAARRGGGGEVGGEIVGRAKRSVPANIDADGAMAGTARCAFIAYGTRIIFLNMSLTPHAL